MIPHSGRKAPPGGTVTGNGGVLMEQTHTNNTFLYIRWFLVRLALLVFDILVVNFAYILALFVRFYVNSEFNVWAVHYIPAWMEFTPYYTVCCLVVFSVSGLYNSLWKYAGMHDINRIVIASIITCLIHILGTLIFVMRMPITYYALGAAFQFVLVALSRFSYRLVLLEKSKFLKKRQPGTVNVMVVGTGEFSRTIIKHLEQDAHSMANPVCVIDFRNHEYPGTMSGIPVVGNLDAISQAVVKYNVERVLLADSVMSGEVRQKVRKICEAAHVEAQDFSSLFQRVSGRIPLRTMVEYLDGPVTVLLEKDGAVQSVDQLDQLQESGKYFVSSVLAENGNLCIKAVYDVLQPNNTQEDWVQSYRSETGQDVSFF